MMTGVIAFSLIISQYIEIIFKYQDTMRVGRSRELSAWMNLLSRFNNGVPLKKDLMIKIEKFFEFYWNNNSLEFLTTPNDKRFMDELP
jgi:hypothetical protein